MHSKIKCIIAFLGEGYCMVTDIFMSIVMETKVIFSIAVYIFKTGSFCFI